MPASSLFTTKLSHTFKVFPFQKVNALGHGFKPRTSLSSSAADFPKYGCINIHASLLPKYRGSAPIQQAVIDGEKESGVTIMRMGTGLDTGDMICPKAATTIISGSSFSRTCKNSGSRTFTGW